MDVFCIACSFQLKLLVISPLGALVERFERMSEVVEGADNKSQASLETRPEYGMAPVDRWSGSKKVGWQLLKL
jgi:hypothetical protein